MSTHRHTRTRTGLACLILSLFTLGLPARLAAQQAPTPAAPATAENADQGDYEVGPGDELSITVYGVPELKQSARVSNSGKIHVTRVGVLNVYRLTARQIGRVIGDALKAKGLVNDPWVQVQVTQVRSSTVYVLGEVVQPGQYALSRRMSLLDLIAMSEGLTPQAEPIAFLYRLQTTPSSGDAGASRPRPDAGFTADNVVSIDVVALSQGKKPELNLDLRGGDVLYVRRSRPKYYFVVGEVSSAGMFDLSAAYENREAGAPLLLSQALARAGGPARTAKASKCLLVRTRPDGTLEQRPFDYEAVLRGRQPDWPIDVNDIIFVPGSSFKTVGYGLLGMLPNIAIQGAQIGAVR